MDEKIHRVRAMNEKDRRILAMETALYGNRLLEEKYFSRVGAAIKNNKKEDFHELCREAKIPDDMQENIYKALSAIRDENAIW